MNFKYIRNTPIFKAFSQVGKRIFLPEGIFYWSGRAKNEAEIIGTIGTAYGFEKDFIDGGSSEWVPCYLKEIKNYFKININQIVPYANIGGLPDTREIWKKWLIKKSGYDEETEKENILELERYTTTPIVTSGVTNGIFLSCALFLNPDEYIISPNKRWGNYDNIIVKHLGAKIKSFDFFNNYKMNLQGLKEAIDETSKTQEKIVIILNFPNNPTGYVPTFNEAKELIKLLKESQKSLGKPIIILVDDAYNPFIYREDVLNKSIFYDLLKLNEDIIPIKLDGITKELLMYGGRIGFITIGLKPNWIQNEEELEFLKKEVENKLEGMNRSTLSNCNHFYQALTQKIFVEMGMDKIIETRNKVKNLLKVRYEKLNSELNKIDNNNMTIDPNSGGFFLFLNLNKIEATKFADHLLKKYKVGVIPIEKPKDNVNGIRIAYCSIDLVKIPEFVNRINLALNDF
ncbi:MAG: aminotransferase class I/II-fold pyridoxal phosphate-dependent enzyme [Promethearchaeota archaeon]